MSFGPADAPVEIVEFTDYQCGPCASFGRRLHTLLKRNPSRFRLQLRHCPSRRHPIGRQAALLMEAAALDDRFWSLHWQLIEEGPIQTEDDLWRIVEESGLDGDQLREHILDGRPGELVARDLAEADRLGVRGTPTTFVNGRRIEGSLSLQRLREALSRE
jgi:Na+:H+ antiporter, NhaA family